MNFEPYRQVQVISTILQLYRLRFDMYLCHFSAELDEQEVRDFCTFSQKIDRAYILHGFIL